MSLILPVIVCITHIWNLGILKYNLSASASLAIGKCRYHGWLRIFEVLPFRFVIHHNSTPLVWIYSSWEMMLVNNCMNVLNRFIIYFTNEAILSVGFWIAICISLKLLFCSGKVSSTKFSVLDVSLELVFVMSANVPLLFLHLVYLFIREKSSYLDLSGIVFLTRFSLIWRPLYLIACAQL